MTKEKNEEREDDKEKGERDRVGRGEEEGQMEKEVAGGAGMKD